MTNPDPDYDKRVHERASELVESMTKQGVGLGFIADVLDEARILTRDRAKDRLRLIEAETGQLKIILGEGPKQRRTDRHAEESTVLDALKDGAHTYSELGTLTKLGTRLLAALERLKKNGQVTCQGKGQHAKWERIAEVTT